MNESRGADELVRGIAWGGGLRVFAARTTGLAGELQRRHGTYPTATAALGRAATAGAMMGAMLKGEEKLTVQVKGDGPLGQIVVDANAKGEVRGYVDNPQVHLPSNAQGKLDVAGAVGRSGYIHIVKDLGLKEPYRGSVPIVSGELGEDFTYYFASSEQTPSAVGLGVLVDVDGSVKHAGGFILQIMPGAEDRDVARLGAAPQGDAPFDDASGPGRDAGVDFALSDGWRCAGARSHANRVPLPMLARAGGADARQHGRSGASGADRGRRAGGSDLPFLQFGVRI